MNNVGLMVAIMAFAILRKGKRCESVTVTSTVFADEKGIVPLSKDGKAPLEDDA